MIIIDKKILKMIVRQNQNRKYKRNEFIIQQRERYFKNQINRGEQKKLLENIQHYRRRKKHK